MPIPDQKLCGARSKRTGLPCKQIAMPNGRCKLHGGKSTGPRKGSQNALKHGIYSTRLTDEERLMLRQIPVGSVDEELKLLRIRLRRAVIDERSWRESADKERSLPLVEVSGRVDAPEVHGARPKPLRKARRLPPFDDIIHRTVGRIGELERIRSEIGGGQADYLAAARKIKEALAEINDAVPGPVGRDPAIAAGRGFSAS